jgi:hypothetical protein
MLGNYTLSDPQIVPLEIGVHVRMPLYLHADSERLNSKPVRVVYDWLSELFSKNNPWFGPELTLGTFPTISGTLSKFYSGTPFSGESEES